MPCKSHALLLSIAGMSARALASRDGPANASPFSFQASASGVPE
jgi:hypothetical protein